MVYNIFIKGLACLIAIISMVVDPSETVRVDNIENLAELTGRDYYDAEIVDIKTVPVQDVYGTGTNLFIFLHEDGPFEGNPDYDGNSLNYFGPYFYEELQAAGVERGDLLSCSTHFKGITIRHLGGSEFTTQEVDWMTLRDSYDGYSNVLIFTYIPGANVVIQDKAALLGTHGKIDKITDSAQKKPGALLYYIDELSIEKTDEGYDIRLTDGEEVNEFFFDGSYNFVEAIGKQQPIALTRSDIIGCIDKIKTVSEMYKAFGTPHADTGSGFYIPIYISVDGTIIYFVCSGDSISGCGCLDISDYFIDQ